MAFWICYEFCELCNEQIFKPVLAKLKSHFDEVVNGALSDAENNVWEELDGDWFEFVFEELMVDHFCEFGEKFDCGVSDSPLFVVAEFDYWGDDVFVCWFFSDSLAN